MIKIDNSKEIFWVIIIVLVVLSVQSCDSPTKNLGEKKEEQEKTPAASTINVRSAANSTFPDPFPTRPWSIDNSRYFFSTHAKILQCYGSILANSCTRIGPIQDFINPGILQQYIDEDQITINGYWAKNVYRDNSDNWHMVASPRIKKEGKGWNIIVHLKPREGEQWSAEDPIKGWTVDKVLIGNPTDFALANYAGKYYKDSDGVLYLVYVRRISGTDKNAIFAQRMRSAIEVDQEYPPKELVSPGSYNSEYRNGTNGLKLIETGNPIKVQNKYVIAYTVGDYADDNYKIGIAWSDHFSGPYKKVLKKDEHNIWGNGSGQDEVFYLLQSQKPGWSNYVKDQILAPGVPSINIDKDETHYLFFAGYKQGETKVNGKYSPARRRPYFVKLDVEIPQSTVASTSPYELREWISVKKQ